MGAASSVPKLKAVLNDKGPAVDLAAAHSRFLLGDLKTWSAMGSVWILKAVHDAVVKVNREV